MARHGKDSPEARLAELERENEEFERHLVGLVREVGELKLYVERVATLEAVVLERDSRITILENEVARLQAALNSGRPTALAAAAAAGRLPKGRAAGRRLLRALGERSELPAAGVTTGVASVPPAPTQRKPSS